MFLVQFLVYHHRHGSSSKNQQKSKGHQTVPLPQQEFSVPPPNPPHHVLPSDIQNVSVPIVLHWPMPIEDTCCDGWRGGQKGKWKFGLDGLDLVVVADDNVFDGHDWSQQ